MTPTPSRIRKPSLRLRPLAAFRIRQVAGFLCLLLGLPLALHATSVTLQGGFGYPNAKDSSGQPLASGHKVSVGTFVDGFVPQAHADDLPTLLANWREFHFTTTETIDGDPGSFWLKHSNPTGTNAAGDPFPDKKIYLLLTRTDATYSEPSADGSNVLDYAVFTSSHLAWTFRFPASETNLPPNDLSSLNTSQIDSALVGTLNPDGSFALASYSSGADGTAFDQWLAATFGENSGVTADSTVGPAGLTALATFALNASPGAAAPPYTTVTDPETGRTGISFTRKKPAVSGFNTFAQASSNLTAWDLPLATPRIEPVEGDPDAEKVTVFPAESTDKAFFRIQVEPAN